MVARSIAGGYRIRGRLNVGPYGTRFKAARADGEPCVLLVLRPEIAAAEGAAERFEKLIGQLGSLPSDLFVPIHEAGVARDGTLYLAQEAPEGETLADLMTEGILAPDRVAGIGAHLRAGLALLHEGGLAHGGLTSQGVIVGGAGGPPSAKLREPGLAVMLRGLPPDLFRRADPDLARILSDGEGISSLEDGIAADHHALADLLFRAATGSAIEGDGVAAVERLRRLHGDLARLVGELLEVKPEADPVQAARAPPEPTDDLPDDLPSGPGSGAMRDTMRGFGADSDPHRLPEAPPPRPMSLRVTPLVPPRPHRHDSGRIRLPGDERDADDPADPRPPPMPPRSDRRRSSRPTLPAKSSAEPPGRPGADLGRDDRPGAGGTEPRISATPKIAPGQPRARVRASGSSLAAALGGERRGASGDELKGTRQGIGPIGRAPEPGPDGAGPGAPQQPTGLHEEHKDTLSATTLATPGKVTMVPWAGDAPRPDDDIVQSFEPSARVKSIVDSATSDENPPPDKPVTVLPDQLPAEVEAMLAGCDEPEAADTVANRPGDARHLPSGVSLSSSGVYLPWRDADRSSPPAAEEGAAEEPAHEEPAHGDPAHNDPAIATLPGIEDVPGDEVEEIHADEVDSVQGILAVDGFFADRPASSAAGGTQETSQPAVEVERQQIRARRWLPLVSLLLVVAAAGFWFQYLRSLEQTTASGVSASAASEPGRAAESRAASRPAEGAGKGGERRVKPALSPRSAVAAAKQRPGGETAVARGPDEAPTGDDSGASEGEQAGTERRVGQRTGTLRNSPGPDDAAPPPDPGALTELPEGMAPIRAGSYPIGCTPAIDGCTRDAMPAHDVRLGSFAIMVREVTVAEYRACESAGQCPATGHETGCNTMRLDRGGHPVNCIARPAARAYCEWRGWRLPREAEWEAAARGHRRTRYPWGSQWPTCERTVMAVFEGQGCGEGHTRAAGTTSGDLSRAGVRDLGGNVAEWVADDYGPYPGAGPAAEFGDPSAQPRGVVRGGAFTQSARELAYVYSRRPEPAETRRVEVGFRCAVGLRDRAMAPVDAPAAPTADRQKH